MEDLSFTACGSNGCNTYRVQNIELSHDNGRARVDFDLMYRESFDVSFNAAATWEIELLNVDTGNEVLDEWDPQDIGIGSEPKWLDVEADEGDTIRLTLDAYSSTNLSGVPTSTEETIQEELRSEPDPSLVDISCDVVEPEIEIDETARVVLEVVNNDSVAGWVGGEMSVGPATADIGENVNSGERVEIEVTVDGSELGTGDHDVSYSVSISEPRRFTPMPILH